MYKLQRNFNKAQAIKKKNFVKGCFDFLRNYFCRKKKKLQCRVWTYNFFSLRKEKSNFIFFFFHFNALLILVPGSYRGYLMAQLVTVPQCPIQSAKESIFIDQCLCKAYR